MTEDWPERVFRERPVQPDRFRAEVLAMHRRVTAPVDRGRLQLPWPRALGTPPWAIARQLTNWGLGDRDVRWIRTSPATGYDAIVSATRDRQPVPVYVGNRWLPRHVVLALGEAEGRLRCYEPARGRLIDVGRDDFRLFRLGLAGWDRAWWAVLPG